MLLPFGLELCICDLGLAWDGNRDWDLDWDWDWDWDWGSLRFGL